MGKPAARLTDLHTCPIPTHVGGPIIVGSTNVFIGGLPAATFGDQCTCVGPPDTIIQGSFTVLINGKPASRLGDMTMHGGVITSGCTTVLIGDAGGASLPELFNLLDQLSEATVKPVQQMMALAQAAKGGSLGCESCS